MSLVLNALNDLSAARDDKDRYRVATILMRHATPAEIKLLAENPAITHAPFVTWLQELNSNVALHRPERSAFRHRLLRDGLSLYENVAITGPKTLVIGLCGAAQVLCSPTAVLLQYFPDDSFDFAVVRDLKGFSTGSFGYAESFPELVETLRRDLKPDGYRDLRCFGVSGGGAPALVAGALLGATKSACFCGRPPTYSASHGKTPAAVELERMLINAEIGAETASIVFGADNPVDARNARGLADLIEASMVPIDRVDGHNVITPLHRRGELEAIFRKVGLL